MRGALVQPQRAPRRPPPLASPRRSRSAGIVIPSVFLPIDPERVARRLLLLCFLVETLLVILDYQIHWGPVVGSGAIARLFDIPGKDGLASWFQSSQTLLAALTVWFLFIVTRHQRASRWRSVGFLLLALGFGYLAIDEGAGIHGQVAGLFPSNYRQVLFLPLLGGLGLMTLVFLWWELGRFSKRVWLLLALALLATAIGLDFVEGLSPEHPLNLTASFSRWPSLELWSQARFGEPAGATLGHFSRSFAEAIEMLAISIFWFLLLGRVGWVTRELQLRFWRS